jgi:hypothetical protein
MESTRSVTDIGIYNLEFPAYCSEITIHGYRFYRVPEYEEKFLSLNRRIDVRSEFHEKPGFGKHSVTALVHLPSSEDPAVLSWASGEEKALDDVQFLLSLFTGREIFPYVEQEDETTKAQWLSILDHRKCPFGGTLSCSLPVEFTQPYVPHESYNIGFEKGLNSVYDLIRTDTWLKKYERGHYLSLTRRMCQTRELEPAFVQCWTIWEHLFALQNRHWLSGKEINRLNAVEKLSYILSDYALRSDIDDGSRNRIQDWVEARNRLIHFGKFPEKDKVSEDAYLFIRLTEFIVAKTLNLIPSELFDTTKKLEEFLSKQPANAARRNRSTS